MKIIMYVAMEVCAVRTTSPMNWETPSNGGVIATMPMMSIVLLEPCAAIQQQNIAVRTDQSIVLMEDRA